MWWVVSEHFWEVFRLQIIPELLRRRHSHFLALTASAVRNAQILNCVFDFLSVCVSPNSYKWLLTEQDALCWQVSQRHQVTCSQRSVHPAAAVIAQGPKRKAYKNTNTHEGTASTHTSAAAHRSAGITVREVSTQWLTEQSSYMRQQFPFTWGQRWGEEGKFKKNAGGAALVYLYGTSFRRKQQQKKKTFFPSPFYCQDDRFIVPIKKRICNEDPRLIAVEKLKPFWDGNLQWSSLSASSLRLWEVFKLTLRF